NSMDGYPWYHADLPRDKAHKSLEEFRRDGAFLVRISKRGGQKNPYTLSLWYNNQVRNLLIRRRCDEKYALGSKKEGEQVRLCVTNCH
ncbi:B-cell linker protein-like, partial [Anneissia japonica]|uniref:B-cell linker protein-like n=1 Tax=Anneissia japonica TaxID=1529436 RepID=UPI0014259D8F